MKEIDSLNWTCIIPAAGKSTRFKDKKNKIFFLYKNKTILEHIILKIKNFSKKIVIVSNIKNIEVTKKLCKKFDKNIISVVVQKKINGMATAIQKSFPKIRSNFFFIIWADQLGISKNTIKRVLIDHQKNNNIITLPVVRKKNPYTLIELKNEFLISKVYQSREIRLHTDVGYSDCGFFSCNTKEIKRELNKLIKEKKIISKKTKEYDFLQSVEELSKKYKIKVIKSSNNKDCIGINEKKDLKNLI